MLKVDFGAVLKDLDGEEIPDTFKKLEEGENRGPLHLSKFCVQALLADTPEEMQNPKQDEQEKLKRVDLARKVNVNAEVELTSNEIVLLKKRINKAFGTLLTGVSYELIEPRNKGETNGTTD